MSASFFFVLGCLIDEAVGWVEHDQPVELYSIRWPDYHGRLVIQINFVVVLNAERQAAAQFHGVGHGWIQEPKLKRR